MHETISWTRHTDYAAAKGGVHMLMRTFAPELAPVGIRANAIAPGAVRKAINRVAGASEAARADLWRLIPAGRIGEAHEIAQAAVRLASDASDHVTGATLVVDGGMTIYPTFHGHG